MNPSDQKGKDTVNTTLLDYHAQSVVSCRQCAVNLELGSHLTFEKLPPFVGNAYRGVLILGHSPKVRTNTAIDTTLDLNESGRLRQYIVNDILNPLAIELEACAAINIVRCLTRKMPEDSKVNGGSLMDAAFAHCQSHLRQEIRTFQPRLVISLSQRVSSLLQATFAPTNRVEPMKKIHGTLRPLTVDGLLVNWIPVVHIPKSNVVRDYYLQEQTRRLSRLREMVQELLA